MEPATVVLWHGRKRVAAFVRDSPDHAVNAALEYLHEVQSSSWDWAMKYEGWRIKDAQGNQLLPKQN